MLAPDVVRAVDAAMEVASELDLAVAEATVLHNSNKLALRLLPCDVLARVAFAGLEEFQTELEIGRRLAELEVPVARLEPRVEPRVYQRHGFAVTLWTYYEQTRQEVSPADYAKALERLHAGMAKIDVRMPQSEPTRIGQCSGMAPSTLALYNDEGVLSAPHAAARD